MSTGTLFCSRFDTIPSVLNGAEIHWAVCLCGCSRCRHCRGPCRRGDPLLMQACSCSLDKPKPIKHSQTALAPGIGCILRWTTCKLPKSEAKIFSFPRVMGCSIGQKPSNYIRYTFISLSLPIKLVYVDFYQYPFI